MTTKQCTKCKEVKSLDEFYNHPETKDGRQSRCKICVSKESNKSNRKRYVNLKNKVCVENKTKVCVECGLEKLTTDFYMALNKDGLATYCKECDSIKRKIKANKLISGWRRARPAGGTARPCSKGSDPRSGRGRGCRCGA